MTYPIIIHGSENSLDKDAYILIPTSLSNQESKILCQSYNGLNANLLVVSEGQVKWCYKGTKDECNNSILATYALHPQEYPIPINQKMQRCYGLKLAQTVRGLLSYLSRTAERIPVKNALASPDLELKLDVLKKIDLIKIEDFEKSTKIETYKFFAFQMGQTLALLDNNQELFTKNSVGQYYPVLKKYLDRMPSDAVDLQNLLTKFIDFCHKSYKKVDHHPFFVFNFHGQKEVIDLKKETLLPKVVIFDIDNTLMDDSHRAHLREKKKWDEYFDMCHLDTPIPHIISLTHEYRAKNHEIWLMSGRSESCLEKTKLSMQEHGVEYDKLKLRGLNVFIPDYILKPAWASKYIGIDRIEAVYDDRDQVIEGFRKKGLNVIDVKTLIPDVSLKNNI